MVKTRTKPSRKEKALQTRRRMLRAAYDVFCAKGYASTTMEAIAKQAGVAVQTLYFTFHTKGAVLSETVGACIIGFDRWSKDAEPLVAEDPQRALAMFHPWFPAFEREKNPSKALAVFVEASVDIFGRVGALVFVMAAAGSADGEVKAVATIGERRRVEAYGIVAAQLAKKGGLRREVSVRHATDILLTILSAETYQQLTSDRGRGWSPAKCRKWFNELLGQQLLP